MNAGIAYGDAGGDAIEIGGSNATAYGGGGGDSIIWEAETGTLNLGGGDDELQFGSGARKVQSWQAWVEARTTSFSSAEIWR